MSTPWPRYRKLALSVFDQAWLSGISFLISWALIRFLEKKEFGTYVLLSNTVLLFQGIGGALLSAPFTTLYSQRSAAQKPQVASVFARLTARFCALQGTVCLAGYGLYAAITEIPASGDVWVQWSSTALTGLGFALCGIGMLLRENIRTYHYARHLPHIALQGNLVYGLLLLLGLAALIWTQTLSASTVLLVTGLAGVVISPGLWHLQRTNLHAPDRQALYGAFWQCGRWAVLGSLMTFAANYTYPYLAAWCFNTAEVADLAAARLLSVPVALIGTSWSNMALPHINRWSMQGEHASIQRMIRLSSATVALLSIGLCLLISTQPVWISHLFGQKYAHLQSLAVWWTICTGLAFIKGIYSSLLKTNAAGFRQLSIIALVNLICMIALMLVVLAVWPSGSPTSLIMVLCVLEVLQTVMIVMFFHQTQGKPRHAEP